MSIPQTEAFDPSEPETEALIPQTEATEKQSEATEKQSEANETKEAFRGRPELQSEGDRQTEWRRLKNRGRPELYSETNQCYFS